MIATWQALRARTPLGWRQLRHNPSRLLVAIAGVVFADVLIFMQLGVMGALFETAVTPVRLLSADILLLSPEARQIGQLGTLPRRRLYQALGVAGVADGAALQVGMVSMRSPTADPAAKRQASVMVFGIDPGFDGFADLEIARQRSLVARADTALLDRLTRAPFGPVAAAVARGEAQGVEMGGRTITLAGSFSLGASFDSDGTLIVSDQTFLSLFPRETNSAVSAILLRTEPGADVNLIAGRLRAALPAIDTRVMTKDGYIAFMRAYMADNTPVGFVFTFGVVIGCIIGFAIVYQILSADVNDHLAEYATFKAMGYTQRFLLGVVFEEALLLAGLGFLPGLVLSLGLYAVVALGTELSVGMPLTRPALVLGITLAMCCASGALATRRLAAADPADVF